MEILLVHLGMPVPQLVKVTGVSSDQVNVWSVWFNVSFTTNNQV